VQVATVGKKSVEAEAQVVCACEGELLVLPPCSIADTDVPADAPLTVAAAASGTLRSAAGAELAAPKTPQARLAPIRVVGELISRGPAAMLVDQGPRRQRCVPCMSCMLSCVSCKSCLLLFVPRCFSPPPPLPSQRRVPGDIRQPTPH
jgi:hypothetical protein